MKTPRFDILVHYLTPMLRAAFAFTGPNCSVSIHDCPLGCRERLDQLERAWWEEEAALSTGPAEQGQGGSYSDTNAEEEGGSSSWQVAPLPILLSSA